MCEWLKEAGVSSVEEGTFYKLGLRSGRTDCDMGGLRMLGERVEDVEGVHNSWQCQERPKFGNGCVISVDVSDSQAHLCQNPLGAGKSAGNLGPPQTYFVSIPRAGYSLPPFGVTGLEDSIFLLPE